MKKKVNLKLNFKKDRIAKLEDLRTIRGGNDTIDETDPVICVPPLTFRC